MIEFRQSVINIMLLCVISTISTRLKEHKVVGNENTESTAPAILDSNPNKIQNEEDFKNQQDESKNVEKQTSKYNGVCWDKNIKKWKASLMHNKKHYYGGLFENEEYAAMNVNSLCDRLEINRKNPTIHIEPDKIQQVHNPTSKYTGVSWDRNVKKWQVQLQHKKKKCFGGYFENEDHAAMKVNLLCDEWQIKRKHPMIIIKPDALPQVQNSTSIYNCVSWDNNAKRWRAHLKHNKNEYYGGLFDKEEDAAMSVNSICDKCEVKRKNPMIDIKLFEPYQVRKPTSQYIGVYWEKKNKKWRALLIHKGKKYSARLFDNEKHAAIEINLLCDEFGMQRKNSMVNIKFDAIRQVKNQTSKYVGVYWNKNTKCWVAQLTYNKKRYFGGLFDKEEEAAMKVNLLCDEYETERKNPTIEIYSDPMQQKAQSSKMDRSKAENIVNEKEVKVEEENILYGLKDQCEDNFMKRPCQSQKRKRKDD